MRIDASTRVLVTGASGCLGWRFSEILAWRSQVTATYLSNPHVPSTATGVKIDLAVPASVENLFDQSRPDLTVHLAALTSPDRCEEMPELAVRTNFQATFELARLSREKGSKMVFVSTDLVFDGDKGDYDEEDRPRPLNVYGTTKLRAEEAVLAQADALVLRSTLMYGSRSPVAVTFLERMLKRLSGGDEMHLFTDQRRNPVLVDDLAQAMVTAIEMDLNGLYHVGGPEAMSRHEFGQKVCEVFGYDEKQLAPISMKDFPYKARRPLDATLNIGKLVKSMGYAPSDVYPALERLRGER